MTTIAKLSIGVAGALGPERIARIAQAAESAGLHGIWVNDTPDGDSLAALAAAAASTDRLMLATGVIPVDRRPAALIAAESASLPQDRLVLGIGSGATRTGVLSVMRAALADLRRDTGARVVLGALGPKMRRLAASGADGALLSWLTPDAAAAQAAEAREEDARTYTSLYVRTALDAGALGRMLTEADRYASYQNYAANFTRLGIDARDTVIEPGKAAERVAAYRAVVDEVVLRAITPGEEDRDYLRFIDEAAALV